MRPVLRWVGGKSRLVPALLNELPKHDYLVEPFAGSSALTFATTGPGHINDAEKGLVEFYQALKSNPGKLYQEFCSIPQFNPERDYYEAREWWNESRDPACFLHINVYGYCGLWRTNKLGNCNVPFGHAKVVAPPTLADLVAASDRLQGVNVTSKPYYKTLSDSIGALYYLDPPYPSTFDYNIPFVHEEFLDRVARLDADVLLSYPDTEMLRDMLSERTWTFKKVVVSQTVGKRPIKRRELFIRNYRLDRQEKSTGNLYERYQATS